MAMTSIHFSNLYTVRRCREIAGMKKNKTEIMLREERIRIRKAAEQLKPLDESPVRHHGL